MKAPMSWEQRGTAARNGLNALRFLLGEWTGHGESDGVEVTGTCLVRAVLSNTFVQVDEKLFDASGTIIHEDLCFYRFEPTDGRIHLTPMMAHAWSTERSVEVLPDESGIRWFDGPFSPIVKLIKSPSGFRSEVWLPSDNAQPPTLSSHMDYLPTNEQENQHCETDGAPQ